MADFIIKRGDQSPALEFQLQTGDGSPRDISGYNDISFHLQDSAGDVVIDDTAGGNVTVVDAEDGIVRYNWGDGDTDDVGLYEAEWEVEHSDGTLETFPNTTNILIRIREDIA